MSATKRAVKSTGDAVKDVSYHLKRSHDDRDATIASDEVSSVEESEHVSDSAAVAAASDKDSNTSNSVQQEDDNDEDSTTMVSNSIHVEQTQDENQSDQPVSVCMGPVLAFLLHDATVAIGSSLTIAAYPTISNYNLILENSIPLSVTFTWILVAFAVGYEVALFRFIPPRYALDDADKEEVLIPDEIGVSMAAASLPPKRGYSILRHVSMRMPNMRINVARKVSKTSRVWTSLATKRGEQLRWQRSARGQVSHPLMRRLLRNPTYQRKSVEVEQAIPQEISPTEQTVKFQKMGSYEPPEAESLKEDVIEPLFVLRGMDVFMTEEGEGAQDNVSSHPFLIE